MVLCDAVHTDPATGKLTILGTFSAISANSYPLQANFVIYFSLTDGIGKHKIQIRIVNSKDLIDECPPVYAVQTEVDFEDPLGVWETAVGVGFPIDKPGVYHCELLCENEVLMSRRIIADNPFEPTDQS